MLLSDRNWTFTPEDTVGRIWNGSFNRGGPATEDAATEGYLADLAGSLYISGIWTCGISATLTNPKLGWGGGEDGDGAEGMDCLLFLAWLWQWSGSVIWLRQSWSAARALWRTLSGVMREVGWWGVVGEVVEKGLKQSNTLTNTENMKNSHV